MEDCPSPQVVQDKQLLTKNASSRKFEILGRGEFFEDETHVKLNRVGGTRGYCVGGQDGFLPYVQISLSFSPPRPSLFPPACPLSPSVLIFLHSTVWHAFAVRKVKCRICNQYIHVSHFV